MNAAVELARAYGVAIEFADLGTWERATLFAEYDPCRLVIRVNLRVLQQLPAAKATVFASRAIAHELHHHRERIGVVARIRRRRDRESAAHAFANELTDERVS
jgi:hypothetical protein